MDAEVQERTEGGHRYVVSGRHQNQTLERGVLRQCPERGFQWSEQWLQDTEGFSGD